MRSLVLNILALCFLFPGSPVEAQGKFRPTVILISIDGFRNDYLEQTTCPNLQMLAASGGRARWLKPVFPTKTFPNHYAQVTGLYPENSGVIGNTMYDPAFDAVFSLANRAEVVQGRWWGGEPIWVTAEKQGQRAAAYFWPGSEASITGKRPSYWVPYDGSIPYAARVRQVLNWLDYPDDSRPTFLTLYFDAVDGAGHGFGPAYSKVDSAVQMVDQAIGLLLEGLKERGIADSVNLVITSDHGMAETAKERTIYLDDYVDLSSVRLVDRGIIVSVWGEESAVREIRGRLVQGHPHMRVYRKEEIPERWRYRNHSRVGPLLLVADEGWHLRLRTDRDSWRTRERGGDHGYDNDLPSMRGILIVRGPAFASGKVVEPLDAVQLYNLFCHLLGLVPAPNDGDFRAVQNLLR